MSFIPDMMRISELLATRNVVSVLPDDVDLTSEYGTQEQYNRFKRGVSRSHINKIRDPQSIGIVVVNFNKRGVKSYIGPNTFAEIAIAFADAKKIFIMNGMPSGYSDELNAWGVRDLNGNLEPLVSEYHEQCRHDRSQLNFPWS
ncbi:hypothetical protein [Gluconacetobacter entanii]|uniref:hypothetical protein n=1 Tax=Gluconacetobacter entanii TaxID=108528 RepID=UPI0011B5FF73|nr:hypothetical protein [Gluconacetobacter entanii]